MIIVGTVVTLAIFLLVGWAVSTEMFQQRTWRRRVEQGDPALVLALLEEAIGTWRRGRAPRDLPPATWAAIQGAQVVAVTDDSATVSVAAEAEYRTADGERVVVASALDQAIALAARLLDMLLYDVPNLRLGSARVDVYATFRADGGGEAQRPILSSTAMRTEADRLAWEAMTAEEILGRFDTVYERGPGGHGLPITLAPVEGARPAGPAGAAGGPD